MSTLMLKVCRDITGKLGNISRYKILSFGQPKKSNMDVLLREHGGFASERSRPRQGCALGSAWTGHPVDRLFSMSCPVYEKADCGSFKFPTSPYQMEKEMEFEICVNDVHIKYNDVHIPGSPIIINIAPDSGEARQVSVHSLKDRGLSIDKPCTFTVSLNGAKGNLHATVRTPSGRHTDCMVQSMDSGVYAVRFIPKENGVHYVDVKLNDAHIAESPIPIMVGSIASDLAMVTASGDGLEHGKCAAKNKFLVQTAGAGSDPLAVFIDVPSKGTLSCHEADDGYTFTYTPFCPGNYLITIKYHQIPIAGSPYQTNVTGQPVVRSFSMSCPVYEEADCCSFKFQKEKEMEKILICVISGFMAAMILFGLYLIIENYCLKKRPGVCCLPPSDTPHTVPIPPTANPAVPLGRW